jgi:3-oxoacyl-[acyl-carrier protein] reductase
MDLGLKGKTALITGASRGLGYATAFILAQEGARVAINSRNPEKLAAAAAAIRMATGATILELPGDLSKADVPDRLVADTLKTFSALDILITNTGGPKPGGFETLTDGDWQQAVEICLMAHVRLIRAALPSLKQSQAASVLAITSISVKQPIPNLVLSNAVRGATIGMIKTLALEVGKYGIRFNSILPASVDTERIAELLASRAQSNQTTIEQEKQKMTTDSPFGRIATPEEFARAAVFLVSPAASYLTGVMLPVDGGMYKGTY